MEWHGLLIDIIQTQFGVNSLLINTKNNIFVTPNVAHIFLHELLIIAYTELFFLV